MRKISKSVEFIRFLPDRMAVEMMISGHFCIIGYRYYKKDGIEKRLLDFFLREGGEVAPNIQADAFKCAATKIKEMENKIKKEKKEAEAFQAQLSLGI